MSPKATSSKKKQPKPRRSINGKRVIPDKSPYTAATKACVCSNLRKASRAVTQTYDQALSAAGISIRVTQLAMLLEIYIHEPAELAVLSEAMAIDRTTLMRNVKLLQNAGLVRSRDANGHAKQFYLTAKGVAEMNRSVPVWEKLQDHFLKYIGKDRWDDMLETMALAVDVTRAK